MLGKCLVNTTYRKILNKKLKNYVVNIGTKNTYRKLLSNIQKTVKNYLKKKDK